MQRIFVKAILLSSCPTATPHHHELLYITVSHLPHLPHLPVLQPPWPTVAISSPDAF